MAIRAAWAEVVHKRSGRADENIVLRYYTVPKKYSAFESDSIAQTDLPFDKGVIANIAVATDDSALENVSESPYPRAWADLRALVDQSIRVNKTHSANRVRPCPLFMR